MYQMTLYNPYIAVLSWVGMCCFVLAVMVNELSCKRDNRRERKMYSHIM